MTRRDLPNLISMLRIVLVVPTTAELLREHYTTALVLFGVAGFSDALDGFLAKRFGWTSRLGSILDPLADKLLLICSYVALGWLGLIPAWLVGAVIARDLVIVSGGIAYHFTVGRYEMAPNLSSKLNTLAQILLVLAVVLDRAAFSLPPMLIEVLVYVVLFTTVTSGLIYVLGWGLRARRALRERRHV